MIVRTIILEIETEPGLHLHTLTKKLENAIRDGLYQYRIAERRVGEIYLIPVQEKRRKEFCK